MNLSTIYTAPDETQITKAKLGDYFKKALPVNPSDMSNFDLRLLYKSTIDNYEKITDRTINSRQTIALVGPPGCGKVFAVYFPTTKSIY